MEEFVNIFAGNPLLADKRSLVDPKTLHYWLADAGLKAKGGARVLPLFDGKPLIVSSRSPEGKAVWELGWQALEDFGTKFPISVSSLPDVDRLSVVEGKGDESTGISDREYDKLVYLGEQDGVPSFAIDISVTGEKPESAASTFAGLEGSKSLSFVDLRSVMVATDWDSTNTKEQLSIAGYARAITEWHKGAQYCARCGTRSFSMEGGARRQCANPACKQKVYPRTDPVVIMLIIDKERDKVILGRQARFQHRMWSCLAGFIEAGESLEEAVRRETLEEVGIQVGDIIYHSSQPWPVGPPSMASQVMIGFFGYAKSFDIRVDGLELESAQWFSREQVKEALTFSAYRQQQESAALQILENSVGGERRKPEVPPGDAAMYVPGPYAIAHSLIATWVNQGTEFMLSKV